MLGSEMLSRRSIAQISNMQSFLPYSSYTASALCLDYRRLGKQRVEAYQMMQCITGTSSGWRNHPAVKMWQPYPHSLALYGSVVCQEWIKRGYKDTLLTKFQTYLSEHTDDVQPAWLGLESFHASHRSNLLRKDHEHYQAFGWAEPDTLPYVWPIL
jgi:hypothetical protein